MSNPKTKEIIALIDALFGDTSVSQESTLSELEEIRSHVSMQIDAINEDLKSQED